MQVKLFNQYPDSARSKYCMIWSGPLWKWYLYKFLSGFQNKSGLFVYRPRKFYFIFDNLLDYLYNSKESCTWTLINNVEKI